MIRAIQSVRRMAGVLAAAILVAGITAVAASAEDLGPPVATKAPDIGARLDQNGEPRAFSDLMGKNGLVLMFFRSADWCPYCQAQLIDVNGGVAEIEKRGYHVAALSYDSPEILQAFTVKRHIAYTFLSDPKSEVIDLYKLRDPHYPPGSKAYGVPRPIIFILDTNGVIKAKLYEESYKVRPPVTAVISVLDGLGKGS
jgi:peroxiredoxin